MFAASFISSGAIFPIYVIHFTSNPIIIGLISIIGTAGYLIPQLFTANRVEQAPIKKFFPFNLGFFFERIPIFLLAPTTFFLRDLFSGISPNSILYFANLEHFRLRASFGWLAGYDRKDHSGSKQREVFWHLKFSWKSSRHPGCNNGFLDAVKI